MAMRRLREVVNNLLPRSVRLNHSLDKHVCNID